MEGCEGEDRIHLTTWWEMPTKTSRSDSPC